MDNTPTVIISIVGVANIIAIGSLVFQAGGLVTKVKTLTIDVENMILEVTNLRLKVVRLESMIERRRFPRRQADETDLLTP